MDSLTQITLGACAASVCVPAEQRRKAALVGAALGTLPDLDVMIDFGDAVSNFTMHRGFSHSLLVLTPLTLLIWIVLRRWWHPVHQNPRAWLAAIGLAVLTHPLLDAHTAYGTQLWWPLNPSPTSWATIFIIDPLYTLPLLVAALAILIRPTSRTSGRLLVLGIILSCCYLSWSWIARGLVLKNTRESLAVLGLDDSSVFLTPSPFNTILWRVVVLDKNAYLEGFDSIMANDGPIEFVRYTTDRPALEEAADFVPSAKRLLWFTDGFVSAKVENDHLIVTDLRMGQEPDYVFSHVVAKRGNPHWHALEPIRLQVTMKLERLEDIWQRIWQAP